MNKIPRPHEHTPCDPTVGTVTLLLFVWATLMLRGCLVRFSRRDCIVCSRRKAHSEATSLSWVSHQHLRVSSGINHLSDNEPMKISTAVRLTHYLRARATQWRLRGVTGRQRNTCNRPRMYPIGYTRITILSSVVILNWTQQPSTTSTSTPKGNLSAYSPWELHNWGHDYENENENWCDNVDKYLSTRNTSTPIPDN